ncbi:MAG: radical SAM/SPASM domain-containing protein [Planctomycetota bacterium]
MPLTRKMQPQGLQFETNTICNGACTFCQYTNMTKREPMATSTILNIIYHHAHRVKWCCPFGMQEPFLEPRTASILGNIKQLNPNCHTTIYSNMSVYDEATWTKIITYQLLDTLATSFYGVSEDTYARIQPPLNYMDVHSHIRRLFGLRQRLNWTRPHINMHLLLTRDTVHGANDYVRYWKRYATEVGFVKYDAWAGKAPWDDAWETQLWGDEAKERLPCHRLWLSMNIHSDGVLVPCCLDHEGIHDCGNIQENPYYLRKQHLEGAWNNIELCKECTVWKRDVPGEWIEFIHQLKPALSAVTSKN